MIPPPSSHPSHFCFLGTSCRSAQGQGQMIFLPACLKGESIRSIHCYIFLIFQQDTTGKQTQEHAHWHCLHEHARMHEPRFHPLALTANCIFHQLRLFETNVPLCEKYLVIDDCLNAFCFVSFVCFFSFL